ncbi:unnamed protein product [Amoebophrya sp. A25]|nr:unnamed protein product [Amoebophrya sp. A25]|eukprot:GSA25T00003704001.1
MPEKTMTSSRLAVPHPPSELGVDDGNENLAEKFRNILGSQCQVKRVDKNRNVIGDASAEEMGQCMMNEQRRKAMLAQVAGKSGSEIAEWIEKVKAKANELYYSRDFHNAMLLYVDCLAGVEELGNKRGSATLEEVTAEGELTACGDHRQEDQHGNLQVLVTSNLAACMLELGRCENCIQLCTLALGVDPAHSKCLLRRGIAYYRLREPGLALEDLDKLHNSFSSTSSSSSSPSSSCDETLQKKVQNYRNLCRRALKEEKACTRKMFNHKLYSQVTKEDELICISSKAGDTRKKSASPTTSLAQQVLRLCDSITSTAGSSAPSLELPNKNDIAGSDRTRQPPLLLNSEEADPEQEICSRPATRKRGRELSFYGDKADVKAVNEGDLDKLIEQELRKYREEAVSPFDAYSGALRTFLRRSLVLLCRGRKNGMRDDGHGGGAPSTYGMSDDVGGGESTSMPFKMSHLAAACFFVAGSGVVLFGGLMILRTLIEGGVRRAGYNHVRADYTYS